MAVMGRRMRVVLDIAVEVEDVTAMRAAALGQSWSGDSFGLAAQAEEEEVANALMKTLFENVDIEAFARNGLVFQGGLPPRTRVPDTDGSYGELVLPPLPALPE